MAIYTVFESVNMGSTHKAERIFDVVADKDIENGTFGYLGDLVEGESNIYNFVTGVKAGEAVVVADQPVWDENTTLKSNQRKDKFIIPAGTPFRVRVVKKTDEFGISAEGITSATREALDVGAYLTIDATGKLVAKASTTESALFEAKVERKRIVGGQLVTAAHNYGYSRVMYEAKVNVLA